MKKRETKANIVAKEENIRLGARGETLAVQYLKKQHCHILARNFLTAEGEIDIIARHKGVLCFIEVKTRTRRLHDDESFGTPATAVNAEKQRRLIKTARQYLRLCPSRRNYHHISYNRLRFDVLEVYLSPAAREALLQCSTRALRRFSDAHINWIRDAFSDGTQIHHAKIPYHFHNHG